MTEYEVRPYRPDDRGGFLSLFETVMREDKDEDWFDWKYERNPYVDHVPMVVALDERRVVGARPLFALPVVINGEQSVALQPGDAMVHPDHRRQGVFSHMMKRVIEKYSGSHPLYFSFPNSLAGPAHIKHGSRTVSTRSSAYRIESPANVAAARTDRDTIRLVSRLGTPVARGYYRLRDLATGNKQRGAVRTESDPPTATLAALYRTSVPDKIHAFRDERFYQWRFNNPDWEYTTYLTGGETDPDAAIVTGTAAKSGSTVTKLTDVVPLETAPQSALVNVISQILADHTETDMFVAPPQGVPDAVLRRFGFHADTVPPLSFVATQRTHVVRSLTGSWTQNGLRITDPNNWYMTFVEMNTS